MRIQRTLLLLIACSFVVGFLISCSDDDNPIDPPDPPELKLDSIATLNICPGEPFTMFVSGLPQTIDDLHLTVGGKPSPITELQAGQLKAITPYFVDGAEIALRNTKTNAVTKLNAELHPDCEISPIRSISIVAVDQFEVCPDAYIEIQGYGYNSFPDLELLIGGNPVTLTEKTDTRIYFRVPANIGDGSIVITRADGLALTDYQSTLTSARDCPTGFSFKIQGLNIQYRDTIVNPYHYGDMDEHIIEQVRELDLDFTSDNRLLKNARLTTENNGNTLEFTADNFGTLTVELNPANGALESVAYIRYNSWSNGRIPRNDSQSEGNTREGFTLVLNTMPNDNNSYSFNKADICSSLESEYFHKSYKSYLHGPSESRRAYSHGYSCDDDMQLTISYTWPNDE